MAVVRAYKKLSATVLQERVLGQTPKLQRNPVLKNQKQNKAKKCSEFFTARNWQLTSIQLLLLLLFFFSQTVLLGVALSPD